MDKTDLSLILSVLSLLVGIAGLLIAVGAGQFVAGTVTGVLVAATTWALLNQRSRSDP